jgi:hypothetical protein
LTSIIEQNIGDENYQTKLMNNSITKVNSSIDYAYRILTNSENPITHLGSLMIKNLHHSYQSINILRSLKDQGLQALNATAQLKWKTKKPLYMFIVSFNRNTDIKTFNTKTSSRTAVTVESIRTNKLILQCKICQSFGHTRNYCSKAPKCVINAGSHLISGRDKPQTAQPKCCHCEKNHPASYRGCVVIKALQKLGDNRNKPKQQTKANKIVRVVPKNEPEITQTYKKTYSQVVSNNVPEAEHTTIWKIC